MLKILALLILMVIAFVLVNYGTCSSPNDD